MDNFFISITVYRICFEVTVQYITLWMQDNTKVSAEGLKFDFFYNIEWVIALFCASFHDAMNNIIGMYGLIVMKISTQFS